MLTKILSNISRVSRLCSCALGPLRPSAREGEEEGGEGLGLEYSSSWIVQEEMFVQLPCFTDDMFGAQPNGKKHSKPANIGSACYVAAKACTVNPG